MDRLPVLDRLPAPGVAPAYTERDVTALLDAQGARLYWYFSLMLGDETLVTRALAATIIVALPFLGHRELFGVARTVCLRYRPDPAVPYARAEAPMLASATKAALRRLEPQDREICALGAPAYRLDDADLAAVFGTWTVHDLRSRATAAFARKLAACAADAKLEHGEDLPARALRLVGTGQCALPYDHVVRLAIDPAAAWIREEICAHVAIPIVDAPAPQGGLELLGFGSHPSVTVRGSREPERVTVPLPRVPGSGQPGGGRRRAVASTVLAAGAIPVAIAVAWAGYSAQPSQHLVPSPLAAAPVAPVLPAASSPANRPAIRPVRPATRHSGTRPGIPLMTTSADVPQGTAGPALAVAGPAVRQYTPKHAAPPPALTPPPLRTTPPPLPAPTTPGNGNGQGQGQGHGNNQGNGNSQGNGNGNSQQG